jgi:hypothetical protein
LAWKLKLLSHEVGTLLLVKDTEKEDRYKAIKLSWETSQAGRASKAKEARENFLKTADPTKFSQNAFKWDKSKQGRVSFTTWILQICIDKISQPMS